MSDTMDLYDALVAAGCEIDNHYSDLYVKATPEALAIVKNYPDHSRSVFHHQETGEVWLDFPFRFTPYWASKAR